MDDELCLKLTKVELKNPDGTRIVDALVHYISREEAIENRFSSVIVFEDKPMKYVDYVKYLD